MNTREYLYDKINFAPQLDFGTIFSQSVELFKKSWIQGFLLQLFILILVMPLIIVVYAPLVGLIISESQNGYVDSSVYSDFFAGFSVFLVALFVIGILVISAVSLCLYAGFYRILYMIDKGENVKTNDFFEFIKGKYLSKALVLVVITALFYGIVILLVIPTLFLSLFGVFYLIVPFTLMAAIFAFNPDFSISDILSVSFKLGNKKWLLAFGLIMVSSLLASAIGSLLCGIGSLFTAAFVYHPVYFLYKSVIGFDSDLEIRQIGEGSSEF